MTLLQEVNKPADIWTTFTDEHVQLILGDVAHRMELDPTTTVTDAANFVISTDPDFRYEDLKGSVKHLVSLYNKERSTA